MWEIIKQFFETQKPNTAKQEELLALMMALGDDEAKSKRLEDEPDLRVIAHDIMVTVIRDQE